MAVRRCISVRKSKINQLIGARDVLFFPTEVRDGATRFLGNTSHAKILYFISVRLCRGLIDQRRGLRAAVFGRTADQVRHSRGQKSSRGKKRESGFARFRDETARRSINCCSRSPRDSAEDPHRGKEREKTGEFLVPTDRLRLNSRDSRLSGSPKLQIDSATIKEFTAGRREFAMLPAFICRTFRTLATQPRRPTGEFGFE